MPAMSQSAKEGVALDPLVRADAQHSQGNAPPARAEARRDGGALVEDNCDVRDQHVRARCSLLPDRSSTGMGRPISE